MIMVQDKLVSDELVEEQFICNLSKCKGACCWEGDMGAPVDEDEMRIMTREYPKIRPFLTEEGQNKLDTEGVYQLFEDEGESQYGATLLPDGRCAFLTFGDDPLQRKAPILQQRTLLFAFGSRSARSTDNLPF